MATGVWGQLVSALPVPAALREYVLRMRPLHLMQGVPAIAAGAAALAVLARPVPETLPRDYRRAGDAAYEAAQHADAALYLTRSLGLQDLPPTALFRLALAHHQLEHAGPALALMRRLAPAGGGGHAPAHYWVAGQLRKARPTRGALQAIHAHLRYTVRADPEHWQARLEIARLYHSSGQLREAEHQLSEAVKQRPEARLQLAGLYHNWARRLRAADRSKAAQRMLQARKHAAEVAELLERQLLDAPGDVALRRQVGAALMLAGRHQQAAERIEAGLKASTDPGLRRDLAAIYFDWSRMLREHTRGSRLGAVELLLTGLRHVPGDDKLISALIEVGQGQSTPARRARRALRERLNGGPDDFPVLYALGTIAIISHDYAAAATRLEAAYRLQPRHPQLANNLAWALLHRPEPDLERALALTETAMRLARPADVAQIRDTRGLVLFKLKRWRSALRDLTAALATTPDEPELHRMLAVVYDKLGMPEIARRHRTHRQYR